MNRNEMILEYCDKSMKLLEIAPFHSPIAPKKEGWNCLSLDIFPYEKLVELAKADSHEHARNHWHRIETVDIISSATELKKAIEEKGCLGQIDRIISSHNFEHLPNPIKFLRECGDVLAANGILSMAIPDKRSTFDFSRPLTHLSEWLRYYHSDQVKPDPFTVFENESSFVDINESKISYRNSIIKSYESLQYRLKSNEYVDTHVSVFTPESFLQIINEVMILNLIPLAIIKFELNGAEFIVHFQNVGYEVVSQLQNKLISSRNELTDLCYKC